MGISRPFPPAFNAPQLRKDRLSDRYNSPTQVSTDGAIFKSLVESAPNKSKRDSKSTAVSLLINCSLVACATWFGTHKIAPVVMAPPTKTVTLVAPPMRTPVLPVAPPKQVAMSGGGGQHMPTPVSHGNPPKFEAKPTLMPTSAPKVASPLSQPTINVQPMAMAKTDSLNLGMSTAPAVTVSAGNGSGAGLGAGAGNGLGLGSGGNFGGGVFKIGGGVTAPQILSAPAPSFTEEARAAKVSDKVVVYLQVSADGRPMHVRVVKGLGMGLNEKAIEAVRQYKFKPAMKDGHPVTVEMNVEVNFQII